MEIEPQKIIIEHEEESTTSVQKPGEKEPSKESRRGKFKFEIDTRDILLLLVFLIVVVAMLFGKLSVERGIEALLVAGGALGVSQYFHARKDKNE